MNICGQTMTNPQLSFLANLIQILDYGLIRNHCHIFVQLTNLEIVTMYEQWSTDLKIVLGQTNWNSMQRTIPPNIQNSTNIDANFYINPLID